MTKRRTRAVALASSLAALTLAAVVGARAEVQAMAEGAWNPTGVRWHDFEEGMERVGAGGRPGVLIFYTDWCPHCRSYSAIFDDSDLVEIAMRFVMIRVVADDHEALNERFGERGRYVPRTFFVSPDGEVDWTVRGGNEKYPYFLDKSSARELVELMRAFLTRHS